MLGYDLGQPLECDGGGFLVGNSISELSMEVLVEFYDPWEEFHAPLKSRVLQDKFGEGVEFPSGISEAGVGEDDHGEGLLRGEPGVTLIHVPMAI